MRLERFNRQIIRLIFAALLSALGGCGSATDRILEETFERSYTVEPTAKVTVKNGDGAIFLYGSNVNEVRVQAVKRAYTRERLKQIAVNVSVQPRSISIETRFPKKPKWGFFDRSGTVNYTIVVPASATLSRLELDNGEVLVNGMYSANMHARLGKGQMFIHNCFGNIDLATGSGTLTLAYEWWEQRKFTIQANMDRGNAWAFLPPEVVCHLVAETGDGKVASDFGRIRERGANEIAKIDTLIHGAGDSAITIRAREGNIKIVEANP